MSDDVFAADGRVIGSRALATRRKLLDATAKLLQEQGILDLRVVDISRHIGSSPATFYQYFNDVDEAILELSKEATEDEKPPGHCCNQVGPSRTASNVLANLLMRTCCIGIPITPCFAPAT